MSRPANSRSFAARACRALAQDDSCPSVFEETRKKEAGDGVILSAAGAKDLLIRWFWALMLVIAGCHGRERVVIGAKNFTESDLLAELLAQQIERRTALPVERRLHLGGTYVCHEAITSGKHPPIADADSVYRTDSAEYAKTLGLTWGRPLGFNNTFAITVRRADAEKYGLRTISDVARVAPRMRAGFGYEFLQRADGFGGLARAYGLRFATPPTAMDLGLTYRALAEGNVDLIAGNSTDGTIQALDLVALEDDRHYFPPYEAAPVMRTEMLTRHPEVARALAELAGKLSAEEMRRLNLAADVEHRDLAALAREWLAKNLP